MSVLSLQLDATTGDCVQICHSQREHQILQQTAYSRECQEVRKPDAYAACACSLLCKWVAGYHLSDLNWTFSSPQCGDNL